MFIYLYYISDYKNNHKIRITTYLYASFYHYPSFMSHKTNKRIFSRPSSISASHFKAITIPKIINY